MCGRLQPYLLEPQRDIISPKNCTVPATSTMWLGTEVDLVNSVISYSRHLRTNIFAALINTHGRVARRDCSVNSRLD